MTFFTALRLGVRVNVFRGNLDSALETMSKVGDARRARGGDAGQRTAGIAR